MSSNTTNHQPLRLKRKSGTQQDKSSEDANKPPRTSSPPSGRSSPDQVCSICLGKPESKCFTNKCLHEFCFRCLLEWSKVKAECPLCKQPFSSIIHNVRSNHEYDEHKIPLTEPEQPELASLDSVHHRFRYRTTLTQERRAFLALERLHVLRQFREAGVLPRSVEPRRPRRSRLTGTSNFRRQTYQRDLWVRPLSDFTGRFRETTPEFFRTNQAMTHRLVPWLNRELNVLLTNHENRLPYVLQLILRMLEQHHIRSRAFRDALRQYFGANTEHFIHEFFQFARSPYDMYGFDENAEYQSRSSFQHEEVSVSESSDEDVPSHPVNTTAMTTSEIPLPSSPQPGPSGLSRAATLSDDGQSYSVRLPRASPSEDDDEDVEIVEVVRPSPPEVITLSDSDESDQEEEDEGEPDTASSSRGKALKPPPKSSSTGSRSSRKDKQLKPKKKKGTKRDRIQSPVVSRERVRNEDDEDRPEVRRRSFPHRQVRYWEMDPEELRQLHRHADSSSGGGGGGGSGSGFGNSSSCKSKTRAGSSSSKPHKGSGKR